MNTIKENKLRVLSILCENLKNPQPQVVGIKKISDVLQMSLKDTRQLLLSMDQAGEIQSEMDGNYSLITPVGLSCLNSSRSMTANY